jgi:hypothetical protein
MIKRYGEEGTMNRNLSANHFLVPLMSENNSDIESAGLLIILALFFIIHSSICCGSISRCR